MKQKSFFLFSDPSVPNHSRKTVASRFSRKLYKKISILSKTFNVSCEFWKLSKLHLPFSFHKSRPTIIFDSMKIFFLSYQSKVFSDFPSSENVMSKSYFMIYFFINQQNKKSILILI